MISKVVAGSILNTNTDQNAQVCYTKEQKVSIFKNGNNFTNILNNPKRKTLLEKYYKENPFGNVPERIATPQNNEYVNEVVSASQSYYNEIVNALNSASSDSEAGNAASEILRKYEITAKKIVDKYTKGKDIKEIKESGENKSTSISLTQKKSDNA